MFFLILTTVTMTTNGFGLGEGGDFHHKCVCGALNRHFCQTRVICGFLKSNYVSIKLGKKLHCHLDIYSLFYSDVRNVNTKPFIFLENKVL